MSLAVAYICIKKLTKTEPTLRIVYYLFSLGLLMQLPFLRFSAPLPQWNDIIFACIAGLICLFFQWAVVKSYALAPASFVGAFQYTTVVFIALIAWAIWDEIPDVMDIIGACITIASILYLLKIEQHNTSGKIENGKV